MTVNRRGIQTENPGAMERRIRDLAEHYEPQDIAEMTGAPIGQVRAILGQRRERWEVVNNRTGKVYQKATERGCYLVAQILGLVDYDIRRAA